jgi:hypothetical protein
VTTENKTKLTGKKLLFARLAWLVLVILTVGPYLAGIFIHAAELHQVCLHPPDVCQLPPVQFTTEDMAQLRAAGFTPQGYATLQTIKLLFFSSIWFAVGGLIFVRKSDEPMALVTAYFLVTFGAGFDGIRTVFTQTYPGWQFPAQFLLYLNGITMWLFIALFPNGRFAPGWVRWPVILGVIYGTLLLFVPSDSPFFNSSAELLIQMGMIASLLIALVVRYRRIFTAVERLQTRWVVSGFVAAFGIIFGLIFLFLLDLLPTIPYRPTWASFSNEMFYQIAVALIPLSIGVAILRYQLFDIDVIIRKTLVYTVLSALLALVYFGMVVLLQSVFVSISGQQSPIAIVISTLVIAALFATLRRRIQNVIDRRFYRKKYNAQQVLAQFAITARDETDMDKLTAELVRVVQETMQPEHVSVWLKKDASSSR